MSTSRRQLFSLILIILMIPSAGIFAGNLPPEDDRSLRVLFTGHLNLDSHIDSVFGDADPHFSYLPRIIRWGSGDIPVQNDEVRETAITYPGWERFSGSVAFKRVNADTLTDIVLYMWGSIGQGDEGRDTMRGVVIFGQKKLGRIAALDVEDIGTFQKKPFVAMELRVGSELVDQKPRDLSGRRSYERLPVDLDVEEADTSERSAPLAGVSRYDGDFAMRVYPNPTGTAVWIEGEDFKEGVYRVEMVAMNGEVYRWDDLKVEGSRRLLETIDVRRLPSGPYVARLLRDGFSLGSYPIIITR